MAGEGRNKVAASLLDLQPTAVLELFRIYPDRINKPTLFLGFHGGALFNEPLTWQNTQYLPLAIESEGFDMLGDGKLARPKIRVANRNNIVTNFLQNYKDFVNAKVIRKRVSVKYLDDINFDGGNPFGVADPNAELTNEEWIMGRKTQESKVFVEFELNSPLDLENFTVNNRGIVAKFCYWQYRGEGCRYEGFPVERDDGSPFLDVDGDAVVPQWPSSYTDPTSATDFFNDPTVEWNSLRAYEKGDIAVVTSPSITLTDPNDPNIRRPLKTVYVCVGENSTQTPEGNPSYWQKDGCTKKFPACQKRFNEFDYLSFVGGQHIATGFSGIRLSGAESSDPDFVGNPINSGVFHSTVSGLTGVLTGDFTLVGWANMNNNSPLGAGLFSTSSRDDGPFPRCRYINIGAGTNHALRSEGWDSARGRNNGNISLYFVGLTLSATNPQVGRSDFRTNNIGLLQSEGDTRDWNQYTIINNTKTQNVLDQIADENVPSTLEGLPSEGTHLDYYVSPEGLQPSWTEEERAEALDHGNFASVEDRGKNLQWTYEYLKGTKAFPQTFMLGAVENQYGTRGYQNDALGYLSTMNGALGPWALWSRVLSQTERDYLYKVIRTPNRMTNDFDYAPRQYHELTGDFDLLKNEGLVAWWDGSTGQIPGHPTTLGMLDVHVNGYHLTGSGQFSGFEESYNEAPETLVENYTPTNPRYGGYPGTDGFSYGRDATIQ